MELLEKLEEEHKVGVLLLGRPYHLDPGLHHGVPDEYQALGYPVLSMRSIPKDPKWLARFFKDDLDRGFITTPLSVQDVWPENYSTNSVQKVWAAKFAARHPNVVVLDLSSFKCGHDAPTYGLIDNIINSSGTPASALHDIDANKPGGSIKIRVKTYAHTLKRFEEELSDQAAKRDELQRRVDEKRRELLERSPRTAARGGAGRSARAPARSKSSRPPSPPTLKKTPCPAGFTETDLRSDIAPPPPVHAMVFLRKAPHASDGDRAMMRSQRRWTTKSIERELTAFEAEERKRLGLEEEASEHWHDANPQQFTRDDRASTTILVGGLTLAHDQFFTAALAGAWLQDPAARRARHRSAALRQGVRQPRAVQPDLLHGRQPREAPRPPARR